MILLIALMLLWLISAPLAQKLVKPEGRFENIATFVLAPIVPVIRLVAIAVRKWRRR